VAPEPAARVPARRPDFTLHDLDGKAHQLAEWDGRPVIVNFWATWCAPCRRELPLLNHLQQVYGPKRLQVVGIAVDFADDVRAFLQKMPLRYPVLVGEEDGLEAARAFGVETMAFPFSAFIDSSGRVLLVHLGELHQEQADAILATVIDVDAGRIPADSASGVIHAALEALQKAPKDAPHTLQINPVQR
jgi:thiol-disulfide isomerase/thioredoxin